VQDGDEGKVSFEILGCLVGILHLFHSLVDYCWVSAYGFPLSYSIYFPHALARIATDELKPPALLRGFGGKRELVDLVAQVVASIDFELPAQLCSFGGKFEVNAKDLRNPNVVVDAPPPAHRLLP
jgi:hypothetical protein